MERDNSRRQVNNYHGTRHFPPPSEYGNYHATRPAKKEKNIVCEKVYNTSSRIPKKICTTVAEREKRERDEEASKKILKDAQTRGGKVSGDLPK